jgi:hypothetical protein
VKQTGGGTPVVTTRPELMGVNMQYILYHSTVNRLGKRKINLVDNTDSCDTSIMDDKTWKGTVT